MTRGAFARVGFTGTQKGMTGPQRKALLQLLSSDFPERIVQFHHGDCIGADEEAHQLVRSLQKNWALLYKEERDKYKTFRSQKVNPILGNPILYLHPPTLTNKRAWCKADVIRPRKTYLLRNHDIVDETDVLIACPSGRKEELRSGTWATVRYARKQGKPIYLVYPDGLVMFESSENRKLQTMRK